MRTETRNKPNIQGAQDRDKPEGDGIETRLLMPIRVLYTIDASPQFLLARQRRKVQVVPIARRAESTAEAFAPGPPGTVGCHRFARVPLKTCLGAVCTSSPELLADRSRDYSVYVLDLLESTFTEGNHSTSKSASLCIDSRIPDITFSSCLREGVSVGMGLMSWCISDDRVTIPGISDDDDDGCVIGKIVMDRGADALEVVIFLRETTLQSQQQHALSLSSLGFHPSSIVSSIGYSSPGNAQRSPKANRLSGLHGSSQSSTSSVGLYEECAPQNGETSKSEEASSTSGHAPRVGRPPGSATNPEKRARRLAIQSHKETLERMENIAKMQQGREYDKTLIRISDHNIPAVTDEEIARQRKILQELESRPLIVDKSRLLTNKPLPKRARSSTSAVPLSTSTLPKRTSGTNATASGSRLNTNDVGSEKLSDASITNTIENKHGSQLLLSLLTSVLGKVDGPPAIQSNTVASEKGKEKVPAVSADDALAGILKELLPLIPNATVQASAVSANPSPSSTILPSVLFPGPKVDPRNGFRPQGSRPPSKPPALFKTAAETFYEPRSGSKGPYDQHWASSTREQPKVREDAHPVPGGGWARGRNLVPRAAISAGMLIQPGGQECVASDTAKSISTSAAQAQPDKENTPPTKTGRGLKRALSSGGEAKDKGGVSYKANDKKRKQNSTPAIGTSEPGGAKRMAVGLTAKDKTNTSGTSGLLVAASSPSRSTASARPKHSLPVMAVSEPDYLSPLPPIVATSTFPDLIKETPRTPPRHETSLDDNAGDSLFTPCARSDDDKLGSLFRGCTHHSVRGLSPSPGALRRESRTTHVANNPSTSGELQERSGSGSEYRLVKTGWDLPPSSPPPPTSPISPHAEIISEQDNNMESELATPLPTVLVEMEKGSTGGKFGDWGTATKSDGVSTPVAKTSQILDHSSDFDMLTGTDFGFGVSGHARDNTEGIELDIEELWSSLGPVIAQAQSDSSFPANSQTTSQADADFSYFDLGDDQSHVETEGTQGGVDAIKLAEDLKALFGGCVV